MSGGKETLSCHDAELANRWGGGGATARRGFVALVAFAWVLASAGPNGATPQELLTVARFRGPVAMTLVDGDRSLIVANRRAGTVLLVDTETRTPRCETSIGKRLSGIAALPGDTWLLVTDEAAHELVLIQRANDELKVVARQNVPEHPVSIQVSPDGKYCCVASLWSRKLAVITVQLDGQPALALSKTIPLPFAPRQQLLVDRGERLVVADAFGGKLAVIDPARGEIESVRELLAHNIRGLCLNAEGNRLLVAHQVLNSLAHTTTDDVHWGMLMGNTVHSLMLKNVLDREQDFLRDSITYPLGEAGHGAADPGAIAAVGREPGAGDASDRELAAVISGTGEIELFSEAGLGSRRVRVGGRPTELAVSRDGRLVYVADELDDSISIVDAKEATLAARISLPRPELTQADRGERLFYDGRLAHDGWMSCHSCHTDGHSNGLVNDNLGDGSFGAPKRVLSLLGVGKTAPWAWNGEVKELEVQIKKSVTTTMRGRVPSDEQVAALAAFVRTLEPPPAVVPAGPGDREGIERGRAVFAARNCGRCHAPPEYTSAGVYDVGLKDEAGNAKFNPPSLRGVGQRDRLFHDNRAASLEEVFTKFRHQIGDDAPDVADLIAFLKSL